MSDGSTNWFKERRLDYIDWIMSKRGSINRIDLMDMFSISVPQASHDIKSFVELYPDALVYDPKGKRYESATVPYMPMRANRHAWCETFGG